MRYFTAIVNQEEKPGIAIGDRAAFLSELVSSPPKTLLEWIQSQHRAQLDHLNEADLPHALSDLTLTAPIPRPIHDVLCVGKNYLDHIAELGGSGEKPIANYFSKRVLRIVGPGEPVIGQFELDEKLDYEVELAVVIGKEMRDVSPEEAWDSIFGFSILNDYSSRTLQMAHGQWYRGKSLDGYTAMGPWICTKDEFERPLALDLKAFVNDELRQNANTSIMIFGVEEMLSEISHGITLEPGDIIATGTPSGVGMGMKPPVFLQRGDKVTLTIEGIGTLENKIV